MIDFHLADGYLEVEVTDLRTGESFQYSIPIDGDEFEDIVDAVEEALNKASEAKAVAFVVGEPVAVRVIAHDHEKGKVLPCACGEHNTVTLT